MATPPRPARDQPINNGNRDEAHGLELRAAKEVRGRAESNYYHELIGVQGVPPIVEEKRDPGSGGRGQVALQTNVYGLSLKSTQIYRYDVKVHAQLGRSDRSIELTKRSADDTTALERKTKCRLCLDLVVTKHPEVFNQRRELIWYDNQGILFAAQQLNIAANEKKQFILEGNELATMDVFGGIGRISFQVTPCVNSFVINTNDIEKYITPDLDKLDHSLQQFLELLTSQYALNTPEEAVCYGAGTAYLIQPQKYGFQQRDCPDLGDGKYLAAGASKSVRFIEGPGGRGDQRVAVVIDAKKTAFHHNQSVLEKTRMMLGRDPTENDIRRLRRDLKGLFVETQHTQKRRVYAITNIVEETAETKKFTNLQGVEVTLQEHFNQTYGINLTLPRSPLVVVSIGQRHIYYPMELVFIADGQRVSASQQTPKQIQAMIRQCAITPSDRVRQISQLVRGLDIRTENKYLKAADVRVTPQPLIAHGRILATPTIRYAQGATTMPDAKSNWKIARNQYLKPSSISDWGLFIVAMKGCQSGFGASMILNFQDMLVKECRSRGLTINPPSVSSHVEPVEEAIKSLFESARDAKKPFLFFISHDDVSNVHNKIKYFERAYGVITQDLKMSTAVDIIQKGKRQTLENIVNKLNMKNGGQNYTVEIPKADQGKTDALPVDRLVIGLSTSHAGPAPRSEKPRTGPQQQHQSQVPSVIGVAANIKKDPLDFVGDCLYQQSRRDEKIGVLQPLIRTFITAFTENRGIPPKSIVLFRNGASEGQYKDILDLELLMVRAVARSCGLEPKITLIVAQKMHNLRLMPQKINPQARPSDQNISPGTVVDSQVIHPAYSEFYLNSHVALQGTARTPRYTVLHDDQKMSMDELENLTYGLSFAHQIVNLTTSLPAPIYIAMRYAERGMNTFVASSVDYTKTAGTPTRSPHGSVPQAPSSSPEGAFDFNRMMTDLSYANCALREFRINA